MIRDHSHSLEGFYIGTWGSGGGIVVLCFISTDHKGYVLFRGYQKRWWSLYVQLRVSLRMTACSLALLLHMLAYVALLIHPHYCLDIPGSLTSRQCEVLADTNQRTAPESLMSNLERVRYDASVPVAGGTLDEEDGDIPPGLVEDRSSGDEDDELEEVAFMVPKRVYVGEDKGEFSTPLQDSDKPAWDLRRESLAATPTPKRLENRMRSLTEDVSGLQAKVDVGEAVMTSKWQLELNEVSQNVEVTEKRMGKLERSVRQQMANTLENETRFVNQLDRISRQSEEVLEMLKNTNKRLESLELTSRDDPLSEARISAALRESSSFSKGSAIGGQG